MSKPDKFGCKVSHTLSRVFPKCSYNLKCVRHLHALLRSLHETIRDGSPGKQWGKVAPRQPQQVEAGGKSSHGGVGVVTVDSKPSQRAAQFVLCITSLVYAVGVSMYCCRVALGSQVWSNS